MKYLITLFYLISTLPAQAALNEVDKAFIATQNILKNPGFENGKQSWTGTDMTDVSVVSSGSNLLTGLGSITWNSDGAGQNLRSVAVAIPKGLYGRNGVASCVIQTPSGTATHTIGAYDGSTSLVAVTVTSSTTPTKNSANFIFPSSGNIQLEFLSVAADEPIIAIDDCYLGPADGFNVGTYAAAQFIGSAYIATTTNCQWSRTNTTLGAFSTDTDCPGPTIEYNPGPGAIQTTDSDLPQFTVNNLPPGNYQVTMSVHTLSGTGTTSLGTAINDGTTTSGVVTSAGTAGGERSAHTMIANFQYTSVGNRTFQLFGSAAANSIAIQNNVSNSVTNFSIVRYPLTSEQSYTADKLANSWSGYHDDDCSWARTSTTVADPTADAACTFAELTNNSFGTVTSAVSGSDKLPGIVFTPSRAGRYFVCGSFSSSGGALNARVDHQFVDGSGNMLDYNGYQTASASRYAIKLCGILNATSAAAQTVKIQSGSDASSATIANNSGLTNARAIVWQIFQTDQSFPAPNLVNSVVNPSSGVTNICSGFITNTGTAVVTRSDGNCLTNPVTNSTGDVTLTFASNVFSGTPNCTCSSYTTAVTDGTICYIDSTTAISSTTVRVQVVDGSVAEDESFFITCIGPK